ncbi:VIT1/CCC1 transporter family protein [Methylobacillus gramineus]|uniref:VIT1/CCC1 transporter family protein n=1 Tax=Methylobacillus gramineus TaxID=755169 RepID=UPI001CFFB8F8|nr:VIT1/CCC1 transporter family protein [Methylobacillus gramineus]MCB5185952.1 VIT1/CCC1 transporter family protein [Methylobacillus gramineus]
MNNWREEKRAVYLYHVIAAIEKSHVIRTMFVGLAHEAAKQAAIWEHALVQAGHSVPVYTPDLRTRLLGFLLRRLGVLHVRHMLAASKIRGLSVYSSKRTVADHAIPTSLEDVGARHHTLGNSGGLRAAVFGVNDGLVSIACLVLGVAGAATSAQVILLTGIAGLLAGAFSMAAGEYISMRSQREMFEYQIGLEREELEHYPEQEAAELALIYQARGLNPEEAQALAQRMIADPELGLDTLTREELGLNPDELGSPWLAAISSLMAFLLGGVIPLLPWLMAMQRYTLETAIALTATALLVVGAMLALFSGRSMLYGGVRMLLIGATAGWLTYWIGSLLGATLT